jgi:hypothetical protein
VGNAKFARLCDLTFPKPSQLWALQRSNDAVPHLPFAAWGFRHPHGVAFLDPPGGDAAVAEGAAESTGSDQASGEAEAAAEEEKKEFDLWARQPEGVPTSIAHSGDRGDDVVQLRPFQVCAQPPVSRCARHALRLLTPRAHGLVLAPRVHVASPVLAARPSRHRARHTTGQATTTSSRTSSRCKRCSTCTTAAPARPI